MKSFTPLSGLACLLATTAVQAAPMQGILPWHGLSLLTDLLAEKTHEGTHELTHELTQESETAAPVGELLPKPDFKLIVNTVADRTPAINGSFADPSIMKAHDGKYYAFSTTAKGYHVPMATAKDPLGEWTRLDGDAMPDKGWTSGRDYWAPDVRPLDDGSYVMYFSGRFPGSSHCVGVSRSKSPTGPYVPDAKPFACPLDRGGAIDPSGFKDEKTGKRYVTYKIDGNAVGNGGNCGNSIEPLVDTPIILQEVDAKDGATKIGKPVAIMHREESDGPVIEAPNIVKVEGKYVLFFSSGCYAGNGYKTKYAVADKITGPYKRADNNLLESPTLGLFGPGGASSTEGEEKILVLHGRCSEGVKHRCMWVMPYEVQRYAKA